MPLLLIGMGGFAGANSRYVVDGFMVDRTAGSFPWGTLAVNASGTFLLGLLFAMTTERAILPAEVRGGAWELAVANLGGSIAVGLVAVVTEMAVGRIV